MYFCVISDPFLSDWFCKKWARLGSGKQNLQQSLTWTHLVLSITEVASEAGVLPVLADPKAQKQQQPRPVNAPGNQYYRLTQRLVLMLKWL